MCAQITTVSYNKFIFNQRELKESKSEDPEERVGVITNVHNRLYNCFEAE